MDHFMTLMDITLIQKVMMCMVATMMMMDIIAQGSSMKNITIKIITEILISQNRMKKM
jgi:hypothetical protein